MGLKGGIPIQFGYADSLPARFEDPESTIIFLIGNKSQLSPIIADIRSQPDLQGGSLVAVVPGEEHAELTRELSLLGRPAPVEEGSMQVGAETTDTGHASAGDVSDVTVAGTSRREVGAGIFSNVVCLNGYDATLESSVNHMEKMILSKIGVYHVQAAIQRAEAEAAEIPHLESDCRDLSRRLESLENQLAMQRSMAERLAEQERELASMNEALSATKETLAGAARSLIDALASPDDTRGLGIN